MSDCSVTSLLNPDRLFPIEAKPRAIARELYNSVAEAPIISPHGHTDPAWFAENDCFANATDFFLTPDHYLLRMLNSQGISMDKLGVARLGKEPETDPRDAWRIFAKHYYLFQATPSRLWLDYVFHSIFSLDAPLSETTADAYFDTITAMLQSDAFRPRALLRRFNIIYLSTTEGAIDTLPHHQKLHELGLGQTVVSTFRPDDVLDPARLDFADNLQQLTTLSGEDAMNFGGYLKAIRQRRSYFRSLGVTATDHGHPTARTADLSFEDASRLFDRCRDGGASLEDHEVFRGHMLTEMARMSLDDGMVMQIHPGSHRNHNPSLWKAYGPDKGADIPQATEYTNALKPLLDAVGNEPELRIILFTLDETSYARELAPLAGHYPCLRLGPPWWFHDSVEGMLRFRQQVTETAGFFNTTGFVDDTRSLLSIPARHDVARRMDARFIANLICEGRLRESEAHSLMVELTTGLVKKAYRLSNL